MKKKQKHEEIHLDLHSGQRHRLAKEMYLKSILQLGGDSGQNVRPIDLVNCLGVTKASVSEMLKKLDKEGFLTYQSFKTIKLTQKGKRRANIILKKNHIIILFLKKVLKMRGEKVYEEACNLEHGFSDEAIVKLEKYLKSYS